MLPPGNDGPIMRTLGQMPQNLEPEDGSAVDIRNDQALAEPSRSNAVTRMHARSGGYVARHPALLKLLEWLGWNNPGGSMNP
jgi:hypothetical protein